MGERHCCSGLLQAISITCSHKRCEAYALDPPHTQSLRLPRDQPLQPPLALPLNQLWLRCNAAVGVRHEGD